MPAEVRELLSSMPSAAQLGEPGLVAEFANEARRRMEALTGQLAAADERYQALFEAMPLGVIHYSADGSIIRANPAASGILGIKAAAMTTWPPLLGSVHEDGSPYLREDLPSVVALRTGAVAEALMGVPHAPTGELRWLHVTAFPDARAPEGQPQRGYAIIADFTEQRRAEAARAEADSAREQIAFLLRAGAFATATRNRHELVEHAAQLVVPGLADHCVVFLPTQEGTLYATSLAHRDPDRAPVLAEFRNHKIPTAGPMAIQVAFTTGTSQVIRGASARVPQWRELGPELGDTLERLRADSVLAAPIIAGQRPLGILSLARDVGRPRFAETDVQVAEEFARLLAYAMANAETTAREHTIAETLQRAVLPGTLPAVPGLDLSVGYLPASDGVHVGGDWYDVFPLGANRVGLVIGDVTGHSITSASIMGQIRSMLRAYAIDHPHPGEVLQRTNTALARLLPEALASAVYAVLDLATGDLSYANAGHPPPLITTGTGHAEYLDDAPGVILGACADISVSTGHRRLAPGTGLLFYTDGLIEDRCRDIDEGLSALAAALRQPGTRTADQIRAAAESVLQAEPSRPDDVCLLAAQLAPTAAPDPQLGVMRPGRGYRS
jgi:PAS domain S-box-containing protein